MHCIHSSPSFCPLCACLSLGVWLLCSSGCYAPGCSLTVCCIGSTGLHLCHSCPSQCLPCSASHSRTCLTLQPLSEMGERRKHILLLWATHTQWAATKCPSTNCLSETGREGTLDCQLLRRKHSRADFKPWMCHSLAYQDLQNSAAFVGYCKTAPARHCLGYENSLARSRWQV